VPHGRQKGADVGTDQTSTQLCSTNSTSVEHQRNVSTTENQKPETETTVA